jgi:phosphoesterase RecJ-like protein
MNRNIYKKIYQKIKKYNKIVIARHIGPDPDALGSSIGLKEIIKQSFPEKEVYVVGSPASKFKYLGTIDKFSEDMYQNSLLIVTDTPDKKRVDGVDIDRFKEVIKLDHHPFIDKFGDLEVVDETSSSASQLVMELVKETKLEYSPSAAEKLFIGLVADTDRFLFSYTTPKTFELVADLIKTTKIDFSKLYLDLYMRPFKEAKFEGFISNNMIVTEHGFAYVKLTEDILKKYEVDPATAGNMVNNFNYLEGIYAWAVFSEDKQNHNIRGSIRSRGPIVNEVASLHNGGGHKFASGVRPTNFEEVDVLARELDQVCKEYLEKLEES